MSESGKGDACCGKRSLPADRATPQLDDAATARQRVRERRETRRWWITLFVQPALLLACAAIVIIGLGIAQRLGFVSASGSVSSTAQSASGETVRYICPMMCTPPQSEPGRCPVCAMELVPATSGGGNADSRSDPD